MDLAFWVEMGNGRFRTCFAFFLQKLVLWVFNFFMNFIMLFQADRFGGRGVGGFLLLFFRILIYDYSLEFCMIIFIQPTVTCWGLVINRFFGLNGLFFVRNQVHYLWSSQFLLTLIFELEAPISLSGVRNGRPFCDRTCSRGDGKAVGIILVRWIEGCLG